MLGLLYARPPLSCQSARKKSQERKKYERGQVHQRIAPIHHAPVTMLMSRLVFARGSRIIGQPRCRKGSSAHSGIWPRRWKIVIGPLRPCCSVRRAPARRAGELKSVAEYTISRSRPNKTSAPEASDRGNRAPVTLHSSYCDQPPPPRRSSHSIVRTLALFGAPCLIGSKMTSRKLLRTQHVSRHGCRPGVAPPALHLEVPLWFASRSPSNLM